MVFKKMTDRGPHQILMIAFVIVYKNESNAVQSGAHNFRKKQRQIKWGKITANCKSEVNQYSGIPNIYYCVTSRYFNFGQQKKFKNKDIELEDT